MAAADETVQQQQEQAAAEVAGQPIGRSKSALEDNIEKNGAQSYYFAHAKRNTGEAPAPMPVHTVIEKTTITDDHLATETIFGYQFLDDDKVVKVYVPLEGVGAKCEESDVSTSFENYSFEMRISNYKPKRVMRLAVKKLFGEVVPEECKFKKCPERIILTLKKKPTENNTCITWSKLEG